MTITPQDFNDLRAVQAQRDALADQEQTRLRQLDDAMTKKDRLSNMLSMALADPRSNWAAIDDLQKNLASVTADVKALLAQADPVREQQLADLIHQITQKVAVLAGKPDPFAAPPPAGPPPKAPGGAAAAVGTNAAGGNHP